MLTVFFDLSMYAGTMAKNSTAVANSRNKLIRMIFFIRKVFFCLNIGEWIDTCDNESQECPVNSMVYVPERLGSLRFIH